MSTPLYQSASEGKSGSKFILPGMLLGLVLLVLLIVWLMRGGEELQTVYGKRQGDHAKASLNGTVVFSEMFRQQGHSVTTINKLSPALDRYDTVVWFPDDFDVPTPEQRDFFQNWMSRGVGRTVIYVGRDHDAATEYWTKVLPQAPKDQYDEVKRRQADAKSRYMFQRAELPKKRYGGWFMLRDGTPRKVTTLSGDYARGVDARRTEITISSRLDEPTKEEINSERSTIDRQPATEFEALLRSDQDLLITRATVKDTAWSNGQVIVVTNGSMLLNYSLINHEHRKLASRLIAECPNGNVAFLESGNGGPPVVNREEKKIAQDWPYPMNAIVFHLVTLAVIFCLANSAIFGRARTLPIDTPADFSKHIQALGKLMQQTKDQAYAYARLQQYRQHSKRDSGKSHKK